MCVTIFSRLLSGPSHHKFKLEDVQMRLGYALSREV